MKQFNRSARKESQPGQSRLGSGRRIGILILPLVLLLVLSMARAQPVTNTPPAGPIETPAAAPALTNAPAPASPAAPHTNAPAKAAEKKKKKAASKQPAAKKKEAVAELKTVPLVPGPAVVIASNVNVRGQAKLKSEIVTRVNKGQELTVLEEIKLKKSEPDEPSAWAKILLPTNTHVYVNSSFIDPTNKTVMPRKLNARSGAGENYSVLGLLKRGDSVKEVATKGEWLEIEAPADAYAFVAAQYLRQEAPGTAPPVEPITATPVTEQPTVAAAPTEPPVVPPGTEPALTNAPESTVTPPSPIVPDEPPPKRIVLREGVVRGTFSIQAPTHYELVSPESGRVINYLYTTSVGLDLSRYKGMRIVVTGEEGLDERWRNTPVITIERIQVVE
jgi:uncharacterized protein YgiM (DUF1202 family)